MKRALLLLFVSQLSYAVVTVPESLNPGDEYRLVFITLARTTALSSDIAFYNDFVTAQANTSADLVALGTTWRVIGSTSTVSAKSNTDTDDSPAGSNGPPIYRLDGLLIASDYDDLWDGTIQNPLYVAQDGTVLDTCCGTWTGTRTNGEAFAGFALGEGATVVDGAPNGTGTNWIQTGPFSADQLQFLYAISDVLTVPQEPELIVIDIRPNGDPRCVNQRPVVIFGHEGFDVTDVDTETLAFGENESGNPVPHCSVDYVNEDGFLDLICKFVPGTVVASLSGELFDGSPFVGSDLICATH